MIESVEINLKKLIEETEKNKLIAEFEKMKKNYEVYKKSQDVDNLEKLKNDLEEFNINKFGKIKVYIKIKPSEKDIIKEEDDGGYLINKFFKVNKDEIIKILPDNLFGPFSKVFYNIQNGKNSVKNIDVFEKISGSNSSSIDSSDILSLPLHIDNLVGRSTILFGYGISGSGKSWTLIGGKDNKGQIIEDGVIQLLIKSMPSDSIKPYQIFEHCLDYGSNFINTDGSAPYFEENMMKSKIITFEENLSFDDIEKIRKDRQTIKATPNNPVSSRSHLFIVYKISHNGKEGYVTFIDSAGKEEPLEIAKQYYTSDRKGNDISDASLPFISKDKKDDKSASFQRFKYPYPDKITDDDKKKFYSENIDIVKNIIKEGFFINESLAHMIYYFTGENLSSSTLFSKVTKAKVNTYSSYDDKEKLNIFYKPPEKSKSITKLPISNNKDPILITSIFDYLTSLSKNKDGSKNFRFIMLGNARTEVRYKDDIIKTFKLVNLLKST